MCDAAIERMARAGRSIYHDSAGIESRPWITTPDWQRESWRRIAAAAALQLQFGDKLDGQFVYREWARYRYVKPWRELTVSQQRCWERTAGAMVINAKQPKEPIGHTSSASEPSSRKG